MPRPILLLMLVLAGCQSIRTTGGSSHPEPSGGSDVPARPASHGVATVTRNEERGTRNEDRGTRNEVNQPRPPSPSKVFRPSSLVPRPSSFVFTTSAPLAPEKTIAAMAIQNPSAP